MGRPSNAAGDIAERCLNGRSRRQWRRVLERSLFLKGVDGSAEHTKWSPDSSMEKNSIVRIVTAVMGIIGKKGAHTDGQVRNLLKYSIHFSRILSGIAETEI